MAEWNKPKRNRRSFMTAGRKAYLRTFEAVFAIILSFLFITIMINSESSTGTEEPDIELVPILKENPDFRSCAMQSNISCLNSTIQLHYPDFAGAYGYEFNITKDPRAAPPDLLPDRNIHAETLFIAGNNTLFYPRVVRLYYWDKED